MADRRRIEDLSIEELQRVLGDRKHQARLAQSGGEPVPPRRRTRVSGWARLLQIVEASLAVGLLVVGLSVWRTLSQSNAIIRSNLVPVVPTAVSTPLIRRIILPASHVVSEEVVAALMPTSDIPESFRVLATSPAMPVLATSTTEPQMAVRITIPAIGVDAPVVHGVEWEQLKRGVGHVPETGLPGVANNVVLAAHNDVFGELFRDLDKLQPGDEIILSTFTQQFRYVVTGTRIVPPTEVSVMAPTLDPVATLISCWPYLLDTERIVVTAILDG